jgi:hypothetical protein
MSRAHKSSRQVLKAADVDLAIQPVVAWLNSFGTVLTRYSCGGDPGGPYVSFYCHDPFELVSAFRDLESGCRFNYAVRVEWRDGSLRYVLRFNSKAALRAFATYLRVLRPAGGR